MPNKTSGSAPRLHVYSAHDGYSNPVTSTLATDQLRIVAEGLPAKTSVTLRFRSDAFAGPGKAFSSEAKFKTDKHGRLDTADMAPTKGSYNDVEPDGLVWSSTPEGKAAVASTETVTSSFELSTKKELLTRTLLERPHVASTVRVGPVNEAGLVGEFYLPVGTGGRIPVITLGGSEGGVGAAQMQARRLASMGQPALALGYFGAPGLPAKLEEIPLEYFERAFRYLDRQPSVRQGKVMVMGLSRGAELALLLGSKYPNVVGVIAQAPSAHVWAGTSAERSAWSADGAPLRHLDFGANPRPGMRAGPEGQRAVVLRPLWERGLEETRPKTVEKARIEVERINGPVLALAGGDDQQWPSDLFVQDITSRLRTSGHSERFSDETDIFKRAGHRLWRLGESTTDSMWGTLGSTLYAYGGTAKANAHAARATDERIRGLIERVERDNAPGVDRPAQPR